MKVFGSVGAVIVALSDSQINVYNVPSISTILPCGFC